MGRLRRLMCLKRGRNLRAGQWEVWTEDWFNDQGLYRLRTADFAADSRRNRKSRCFEEVEN